MTKHGFHRVAPFAHGMSVLLFATTTWLCRSAFAAPSDQAPAAPSVMVGSSSGPVVMPADGSMKVIIVEVTGKVRVRLDPKSPWQEATAQMVVGETASFQTGPRSSVTCVIPPDQTFTLDRLGTATVSQAIKNGSKVKSEVLMKYGRVKYSIEAAGLEHEATIVSPSSTLAIRGTVVALYDQPPFAPEATSYTGRAMFRDYSRIAAAAVGSKGGGKSVIAAGKSSAAQTALGQTVVDPHIGSAALTASEQQFISQEVSRGGVVSYDPFAEIAVVRNAAPFTDAELVKTLPGPLDFVVRWDGPADINLEVFIQKVAPTIPNLLNFKPTEFLYPGFGLNTTADGGLIPFDNRGGPKGGMEVASFPTVPGAALYGIAALDISGKPVNVTIDAFVNGQKGQLFFLQNGVFTIANEETQKLSQRGDFETANFTIPDLFPPTQERISHASRHRDAPTPTVAAIPKPVPVTGRR